MGETGSEQLISGERPRSRTASILDCHQTLGSLIHMNVQGGFSFRRSSLYFVCQETDSVASNKTASECDSISIREDAFASGFSKRPGTYDCFMPKELSVLLPYYSAVSSLIGISVGEVGAKLIVLSNTIKALAFWLCEILYLMKKENKGVYFYKD